MTVRMLLTALAAVLCGTSAYAQTEAPQTWSGPDPERRGYILGHAQENFETAITEICLPFILQHAPADTWTRRLHPGIAWYPPPPVLRGLTSYLVGGSSGAVVGVGDRGSGPECTLMPASQADLEEAEATLRAVIARMPVPMTESGAHVDPGPFQRRLTWCAPPDGPHYVVVASIGVSGRVAGTRMFVTFAELSEHDPRCDVPVAN